jgi:hypothetical protein
MADFQLYRLLRDQKTLLPLGITCEDMNGVREKFKERGRSENEQLVVLSDGQIHAVERRDGEGFAMVDQDRQSIEDQYWYPEWEEQKRAARRRLEMENVDDDVQDV